MLKPAEVTSMSPHFFTQNSKHDQQRLAAARTKKAVTGENFQSPLQFNTKKKECSGRVPSKNASVDREHRDSPEHSSSQPRQCSHRQTCDFCVSRFSHDFRKNIPLPRDQTPSPGNTLDSLSRIKAPRSSTQSTKFADSLIRFQNRIRRVGRCALSLSSQDFREPAPSAPYGRINCRLLRPGITSSGSSEPAGTPAPSAARQRLPARAFPSQREPASRRASPETAAWS